MVRIWFTNVPGRLIRKLAAQQPERTHSQLANTKGLFTARSGERKMVCRNWNRTSPNPFDSMELTVAFTLEEWSGA
jgi:hypothetical protein